jgi:hypothetical protein
MSDDRGLDQQTTQRVLDRAMQLDLAAGERLKPAQIRTIAAELGISTDAIEQALTEHAATVAPNASPVPVAKRRLSTWFARSTMALGVAFILLLALTFIMRLFPR